MREDPKRLFAVLCGGCGRTLMAVDRIRDPQVDALRAHLRDCAASSALGQDPTLDDIMRRLRVTVVEQP